LRQEFGKRFEAFRIARFQLCVAPERLQRLGGHAPGSLYAPQKQKRVGTGGRLRSDARYDFFRFVEVACAESVIGKGQ